MGNNGVMAHFLLIYNRQLGVLLSEVEFDGDARESALDARFAAEAQYADNADVEIVVLSAGSHAELEQTHGRYFHGAADILAS
jgi:hypothetical protein